MADHICEWRYATMAAPEPSCRICGRISAIGWAEALNQLETARKQLAAAQERAEQWERDVSGWLNLLGAPDAPTIRERVRALEDMCASRNIEYAEAQERAERAEKAEALGAGLLAVVLAAQSDLQSVLGHCDLPFNTASCLRERVREIDALVAGASNATMLAKVGRGLLAQRRENRE